MLGIHSREEFKIVRWYYDTIASTHMLELDRELTKAHPATFDGANWGHIIYEKTTCEGAINHIGGFKQFGRQEMKELPCLLYNGESIRIILPKY